MRASTLKVARKLDRPRREDPETPSTVPVPSGTWRRLAAPSSGFVVDINARALLSLAVARGLSIHMEVAIGDPVVRGSSLGRVVVLEGAPLEKARIAQWVERTVLIGPWREPDMDLALGVRQLVDMAIKALSPGINDPSTAVESVDQLTILLCGLCPLRQGPRVLADSEGRPRVFLRALELRDYLVLATEQISRYGAGEPAVVLRLLRLAGEVGLRVSREPDSHAVREVLHQVRADAEAVQPGLLAPAAAAALRGGGGAGRGTQGAPAAPAFARLLTPRGAVRGRSFSGCESAGVAAVMRGRKHWIHRGARPQDGAARQGTSHELRAE